MKLGFVIFLLLFIYCRSDNRRRGWSNFRRARWSGTTRRLDIGRRRELGRVSFIVVVFVFAGAAENRHLRAGDLRGRVPRGGRLHRGHLPYSVPNDLYQLGFVFSERDGRHLIGRLFGGSHPFGFVGQSGHHQGRPELQPGFSEASRPFRVELITARSGKRRFCGLR